MGNIFDVVPPDLFTLLGSPNRAVYADALSVLHEVFQQNLKIARSEFCSNIQYRLENELEKSEFFEEGIHEDEAADLKGKAHFLVRKLKERGWIGFEMGYDLVDNIVVPDYTIRLLDLFSELSNKGKAQSGFSYVYDTYSTLTTADKEKPYEKMMALAGAHDKTNALIRLLKSVYHNIHHYFQEILEFRNVNQILQAHYDSFLAQVVEACIKPLKIKDSVPKYKGPIQSILSSWLDDSDVIAQMANEALSEKMQPTLDECRREIMGMIFFIKGSYDTIQREYLNEIDSKVRKYTRTTTQKIESLSNNDPSVRGNLRFILQALSEPDKADAVSEAVSSLAQIHEQSWIGEDSLYSRKKPVKREKGNEILLSEDAPNLLAKAAEEFDRLVNSPFSRKNIWEFMRKLLEKTGEARTSDIMISSDDAYVISCLAVIHSSDKGSFYGCERFDGINSTDVYGYPNFRFYLLEKPVH
jgi:hypothetical protein